MKLTEHECLHLRFHSYVPVTEQALDGTDKLLLYYGLIDCFWRDGNLLYKTTPEGVAEYKANASNYPNLAHKGINE